MNPGNSGCLDPYFRKIPLVKVTEYSVFRMDPAKTSKTGLSVLECVETVGLFGSKKTILPSLV